MEYFVKEFKIILSTDDRLQDITRIYIEQVTWTGTQLIFISEVPHIRHLTLRFWTQKQTEQGGVAVNTLDFYSGRSQLNSGPGHWLY
jgi:hypothetical protein